MNLWCTVRRVQAVLLPALTAFVVVVVVAHDQYIRLPALIGTSGNQVFLMQLAPLIVVSALAHGLGQVVPEAEGTAQRPIRVLDTALIGTLTGSAALAALTVAVSAGSPEASMAGRNTLFLTGLMLMARRIHEQAATAVPVGWVLAVTLIGYRDVGRPWPWALTLHPAGFLPTLALCLLVFAAGLTSYVRPRRT
ncbi:hypothetical protein ACGFT2_24605 [Streptomyces sp. NPDC048514]|uniref:hypothetical protein n=1 Tax=Streptomyces sp. NPDC048514 TaxID=3365564 RepID=UPI00371173C3